MIFDHIYSGDPGHRFYTRLEKLGFKLKPSETEHHGRHFCRFIAFKSQPGDEPTYLEFINVKSGGEKVSRPGISLSYSTKLETLYKKLKKSGILICDFKHKNYEWKLDSKSRLPGWNFLTFKNLRIRGFFPWITEYETPPQHLAKKRTRRVVRHPNGAQKIVALDLEINSKGRSFFEQLFGTKFKDSVTLGNGVTLHFKSSRRNVLNSVIIQSKNLKYFQKRSKVDEQIKWRGRPAALIENPANHWNIVVI